MKAKLKEYIDTIFADAERRAPHNQRVRELKEEMLQNLNDRYDDLLAKGKTPAVAYNIAVAGVGDISGLLDSVVEEGSGRDFGTGGDFGTTPPPAGSGKRPLNTEELERVHRYRERSAILTSVAVAMYILCWLPLVILSGILGNVGDTLGLVIMFGMIAGATCMLIYNSMTKPKFGSDVEKWDDDDEDDDDDDDDDDDRKTRKKGSRPRRSPVYHAISSALFIVMLCGYLLISFATGAWHITWMIFLIYAALDGIIKAIFDLRR